MSEQKIIFSLTVSRSDLGRMAPLYRLLDSDESIDLRIVSAGAHGMDSFGDSRQYFEDLGLSCSNSFRHEEDTNPAAESSFLLWNLSELFKEEKADYLLILGDRFEMLAASQAALFAGVPILHVGGGHVTEGAIDEQCRHAISKLANRHYVASYQHQQRLRQMGEDHNSIIQSGAPDIDALMAVEDVSKEEFIKQVGLFSLGFVLVTIHPETHSEESYRQVFDFLNEINEQVLITAPCQDEGCQEIFDLIEEYSSKNPKQFIYHAQLGQKLYVNAMRHCKFMLGNSSSGIIESASIPVPVINVGARQLGRERAGNVIDSSWEKSEVMKAYEALADCKSALPANPYGDGKACEKIYQDILQLPKKMGTSKKFVDFFKEEV